MLAARAEEQRNRSFAFTPSYRKPAGHVGRWNPLGARQPIERAPVVPAHINSKTMVPHQHRRALFRGYPPVRIA